MHLDRPKHLTLGQTQQEKKQLRSNQQKALDRYACEDFSESALAYMEGVVISSPYSPTFCNYRRKLLLTYLTEQNVRSLLSKELRILKDLLAAHRQSRALWNHKKWVLERCVDFPDVIEAEREACEAALKADPMNPHAWNYRAWVVKLQEIDIEEELQLTQTMINQNFQNTSAWHYRSKLIRAVYTHKIPDTFIEKELGHLRLAYLTCPGAQCIWNYHRWLMGHHGRIQVTGVFPGKYLQPPAFFLLGFSHKVGYLSDSSVAVSDGWEPLPGEWSPYRGKEFAYIWKFTPQRKPRASVEIRFSPVNETLIDVNGFKQLTSVSYKYRKQGQAWQVVPDGCDEVGLLERELAELNQLLEGEKVVPALVRKAQILDCIRFSHSGEGGINDATDCFHELIRLDREHEAYYSEALEVYKCLKLGEMGGVSLRSERLLAQLVGLFHQLQPFQ